MPARSPFLAILILLAAGPAAGQDPPAPDAPKPPEPVFVRLSVYPTASLSRYDYNNDVDLDELRVYVELRRVSQEGAVIPDALVRAAGGKADFVADHYEKRTVLERGRRPAEIEIEIGIPGRSAIREKLSLPDWLSLTEPRPAIVDPAGDLTVGWRFDRFAAPVDVRAYDFKTGKEFFARDNLAGTSVVIPSSRLPGATTVRVYIIASWLYKRFLGGPDYARGSEVNVIPWSQVFVRTK
jgi:hypothetical protein